MLKSSLCDHSDAYIPAKETIIITGREADPVARQADEKNNYVTLKNCKPFSDCLSEINNAQIDKKSGCCDAKDLDVVMTINGIQCQLFKNT